MICCARLPPHQNSAPSSFLLAAPHARLCMPVVAEEACYQQQLCCLARLSADEGKADWSRLLPQELVIVSSLEFLFEEQCNMKTH
jgi:hypothetical protein